MRLDPRHGRLAREALPVAPHELGVEALDRDLGPAVDERVPARVVAVAELRRDDELAHRLPDRLRLAPAEQALRGRVPGQDVAVPVERDERVRCGVEHESGALLRIAELLRLRLEPAEQTRDEEARHDRRADGEQPPHDHHVRLLHGQRDAVRHGDGHHVRGRLTEREEVARIQHRPRVEQRVERGRARVVVGQAHDHRAGDEQRMDVPLPEPVRKRPDDRGDDVRERSQDYQRTVPHLVRVREDERQQRERRTRRVEVCDRARLEANVE